MSPILPHSPRLYVQDLVKPCASPTKENINQMSSSDSGKDSNVRYGETTAQHKSSKISDLSLFNNSGRTEIKNQKPTL